MFLYIFIIFLNFTERNSEEYLDKALLVWSPTYQISDLEGT